MYESSQSDVLSSSSSSNNNNNSSRGRYRVQWIRDALMNLPLLLDEALLREVELIVLNIRDTLPIRELGTGAISAALEEEEKKTSEAPEGGQSSGEATLQLLKLLDRLLMGVELLVEPHGQAPKEAKEGIKRLPAATLPPAEESWQAQAHRWAPRLYLMWMAVSVVLLVVALRMHVSFRDDEDGE
ncbi:hypothetical protein AK812_SmicGene2624 [Symbiodinium microadriaticum]|uniref:Uncharacterized protein n=1 Tax=Symbiodinium microadriaticum TaxID=2951 RepID=A0A1Q9F122_SYMMI|nr:hypothetical protein AK812_SmicGene2624 [Symbiodinium microadriaticum]